MRYSAGWIFDERATKESIDLVTTRRRKVRAVLALFLSLGACSSPGVLTSPIPEVFGLLSACVHVDAADDLVLVSPGRLGSTESSMLPVSGCWL